MKSSVSLSLGAGKAKAVTKRIHDEEEAQDVRHVSEFRSGDAPGEQEGAKRKARKVIPCKPNKLTTKKDAGDVGALKDRFENAAVQKEAPKEYGLVAARQAGQQQQGARAQQPNATTSTSRATWQSQAAALPEAPHADAYDDMPVEDFGLALLRGMGMKQEDNVATVQYIARPSRMGLGAKPGDMGAPDGSVAESATPCGAGACSDQDTHHARAATGKRSYKELVGADGGAKSVVRAGDAVIDTATLGARVGKRMVVAAGRHEGLECVVRKLDAGGQEGASMAPCICHAAPSTAVVCITASRPARRCVLLCIATRLVEQFRGRRGASLLCRLGGGAAAAIGAGRGPCRRAAHRARPDWPQGCQGLCLGPRQERQTRAARGRAIERARAGPR